MNSHNYLAVRRRHRLRPIYRQLSRTALLTLMLAVLGLWITPARWAGAGRALELPVYLPLVVQGEDGCLPIPGASYAALSIVGPPTSRPAQLHPDLNLALRGYQPTTGFLGLVDIAGPADPAAPQLATLFWPPRVPQLAAIFRVYEWDWTQDRRGEPIVEPAVTLAHMVTSAGEIIYLPDAGYRIGSGYAALVLYASAERITLKYTREDNVIVGYTLHVEGLCVEPRLVALYESLNNAGRSQLPALSAGQPLGRARTDRIGVAIRDCGLFMDPRSRKDWWQATWPSEAW